MDSIEVRQRCTFYEEQLIALREWCLEKTGIDVNDVIGESGYSNDLVGCVTKIIEDNYTHNAEASWSE